MVLELGAGMVTEGKSVCDVCGLELSLHGCTGF